MLEIGPHLQEAIQTGVAGVVVLALFIFLYKSL